MNNEDEEPIPIPGMYDDHHGQKLHGVPFWKRVGTTRFLVFLFGAIVMLSFDWLNMAESNVVGNSLILPVLVGLVWTAFFSPNYLPGKFILDFHREGVDEPKKGEFAGFSIKRGFWTLVLLWITGAMFLFTSTLLTIPIALIIDLLGLSCKLPANFNLC